MTSPWLFQTSLSLPTPPFPLWHTHSHTLLHLAHPHHHWGRPPWERRALKTPTHWLVSGNLCQRHASARRSASTCTQSTEMIELLSLLCVIVYILQKKKCSPLFLRYTNQNDQNFTAKSEISRRIIAFNVFVFAQEWCTKPGDELVCVHFIIVQFLLWLEGKNTTFRLFWTSFFLNPNQLGSAQAKMQTRCPWRILLVGTYFAHNP